MKGLRGHVSRSPSASADRHAFEAVRLRQRPPRITVTAKSRTKEVHRQKYLGSPKIDAGRSQRKIGYVMLK